MAPVESHDLLFRALGFSTGCLFVPFGIVPRLGLGMAAALLGGADLSELRAAPLSESAQAVALGLVLGLLCSAVVFVTLTVGVWSAEVLTGRPLPPAVRSFQTLLFLTFAASADGLSTLWPRIFQVLIQPSPLRGEAKDFLVNMGGICLQTSAMIYLSVLLVSAAVSLFAIVGNRYLRLIDQTVLGVVRIPLLLFVLSLIGYSASGELTLFGEAVIRQVGL